MPITNDEKVLKMNCPHIVVGTPGRILALARKKILVLKHIKHFILDECDKMLDALGKVQSVKCCGLIIFKSIVSELKIWFSE